MSDDLKQQAMAFGELLAEIVLAGGAVTFEKEHEDDGGWYRVSARGAFGHCIGRGARMAEASANMARAYVDVRAL
jgi:DhnA family fructose-bisphosphate aldolase class Ia